MKPLEWIGELGKIHEYEYTEANVHARVYVSE